MAGVGTHTGSYSTLALHFIPGPALLGWWAGGLVGWWAGDLLRTAPHRQPPALPADLLLLALPSHSSLSADLVKLRPIPNLFTGSAELWRISRISASPLLLQSGLQQEGIPTSTAQHDSPDRPLLRRLSLEGQRGLRGNTEIVSIKQFAVQQFNGCLNR